MKKVLVIDDDHLMLSILRIILRDFECVCTYVDNGKEALEHISTSQYDVVLCDLMLPFASGLEIAEDYFKRYGFNENHLFIMITSFGNEELAAAAKKIGIDQFLNKPLDDRILKNFLTAVLPKK